MNPEVQQLKDQVNTLAQTVAGLVEFIGKLNSNVSIPFDVGGAMKARVLDGAVSPSSMTAGSQSLTTSAGGGNSVAKPMAGFIILNLNGISYNIPYYV